MDLEPGLEIIFSIPSICPNSNSGNSNPPENPNCTPTAHVAWLADEKLLIAFSSLRPRNDAHAPVISDLVTPFIYDLKTGKKTVELEEFPKEQLSFLHAEFTNDGKNTVAFFGRKDGCFQFLLHAADTGRLLKTLPVDSPVHAIALSPDGKKLAAFCAEDGLILDVESDLTKINNRIRVGTKRKVAETVLGYQRIAFVGNGFLAVLAARGFDIDARMEGGEIKLYDTEEWKLRHTFEKKGSSTHCIAGSPDGRWLAAGFGIDGSVPGGVCIWETVTGKLTKELK